MRLQRNILAVAACALFAGCGSNETCDEPQRYQAAREGVRINTPDDLDELQGTKELTVPSASPRDPRPAGSPCLELPPVLRVVDDDEAAET